jgi:SAM-dependent MidA family methyltransferase
MPFHDFMERALYAPGEGYYARPQTAWSAAADFVTAPQVDASFGVAVALLAQECDAALGGLESFDLVEMGGGDGALLGDACDALERRAPQVYERTRVWSIERGDASRAQQRDRLAAHAPRVEWIASLDELPPGSLHGLVVSNELLDAFPVHRVVWRGGLRELYVDIEGEDFVERELAPSVPELAGYLAANHISLQEGQVAEICLHVAPWVESVARSLAQGFVCTADYGAETAALYDAGRMNGSLVCQHRYQLTAAAFERIGEQDITAHVDFGNLRRCGATYGLADGGIASLAVFLVGFGAADDIAPPDTGSEAGGAEVRRRLGLRHLLFSEIGDAHRVMLQSKGVAPIPFGLSRLG